MRRLTSALGIAMLGLTAGPAAAQAIRVEVGVNAPPVLARVEFGRPIFTWNGYPDYGIWRTDPYLVRLNRAHLFWLARERARFDAMRRHDHRYWDAVRVYERERVAREAMLERAYRERLGDYDRGWDRYRDRDRDWDRDRHGHREGWYGERH